MIKNVISIKVDYDGDLEDYDGYEWDRDGVEYIIASVTRLDDTFWRLGIYVTSEHDMDSNAVLAAFNKEFYESMRVSIEITPAEYAMLRDICLRHDLRLNVESIEE